MTKLLFNIRLAEQFVLMYAFKRLFGFEGFFFSDFICHPSIHPSITVRRIQLNANAHLNYNNLCLPIRLININ